MDKAILRILGYQVTATLGQGSFGKVQQARSEHGTVAIKIIRRRKMARREPFSHSIFLAREICILGKVTHPHIIHVHKIREIFIGRVYIMMESAVTNLHKKIIELSVIPIDQAKKWFCQLLSAMVYLHENNIVHRDLKCQNILLTFDDQVKLTDFGFARFSGGYPELSKTYCGSVAFSAPEQFLRQPYDPKKSDVWSIGIIFYSMITGMSNLLNNLLRIRHSYPVFPKTVEKLCCNFIAYVLQLDPSTRPSMSDVGQHPWIQPTFNEVCSSLINIQSRGRREEEPQPSCFVNKRKDECGSSPSWGQTRLFQVKEESGCFKHSSLFTDTQRAPKVCANVKKGILRACRSLKRTMKKSEVNNLLTDPTPPVGWSSEQH